MELISRWTKMIKLFVTDLDGTLLYKKVKGIEPNKYCKEAVERLQANGIDFAIATGRYDSDVQQVENYLPLKRKGYRIGINGATVYNPEGVKIRELFLVDENARNVFNFVDKKLRRQTSFIVTCTETEERFYHKVGFLFNPFLWFFWKGRAENIRSTDIEEFITSDRQFYKLLVSASKDNTDYIDLKLQNQFSDFEVFKTSPYSVEICPAGANKGSALEYIMEVEGLRPDEVAFVGDSGNDIAAFKVVKHSFVMSHSDHYVQEHARYVVNDVAEAIDMVLRYNADLCCHLPKEETGKIDKVEAMRQAQIDNREDRELIQKYEEDKTQLTQTQQIRVQKVRQRQRVNRQK